MFLSTSTTIILYDKGQNWGDKKTTPPKMASDKYDDDDDTGKERQKRHVSELDWEEDFSTQLNCMQYNTKKITESTSGRQKWEFTMDDVHERMVKTRSENQLKCAHR